MPKFDANLSPARWRVRELLSHTLRRAWAVLATLIQRRPHQSLPLVVLTDRAELLQQIRTAIRLGLPDEAEAMIEHIGAFALNDAECLNLRGVICEARGAWKNARRWYGRAIRANRSHAAAQQNMLRIYELNTFGRSKQPIALGDERPALTELLDARDVLLAESAVMTRDSDRETRS
jgi:hypothetical protein